MQTKIRPYRVDFFLKINKGACTSIRYTRVCRLMFITAAQIGMQSMYRGIRFRFEFHDSEELPFVGFILALLIRYLLLYRLDAMR